MNNAPNTGYNFGINKLQKALVRLAIEQTIHEILCAPSIPIWYMNWNSRYNNLRIKEEIRESLRKVAAKYHLERDECIPLIPIVNSLFNRIASTDKTISIEKYQYASQRVASLKRVKEAMARVDKIIALEALPIASQLSESSYAD